MVASIKAILLGLLFYPFLLCAEVSVDDSLQISLYPETTEGLKFSPKQLIIPGVLIGMGVYGTIDGRLDKEVRDQALRWNGNTHIDDVLTLVPGASIYLLDWCGVRSKHNFLDKTVITATSAMLTIGTVYLLKYTTSVERPDKSDYHSFPSNHTAVAFAGAELLRQEYGDRSIWYGIAGYSVAACTGFFRVYNNKHWLSDVLTGAGIGILSTQAAYWLYPSIRNLYGKNGNSQLTVLPFASSNGFGISLSAGF